MHLREGDVEDDVHGFSPEKNSCVVNGQEKTGTARLQKPRSKASENVPGRAHPMGAGDIITSGDTNGNPTASADPKPAPTGMLGARLASLDVPSSARLVSVKTSFAPDGSTEWTVVFRSAKADVAATPTAAAPTRPLSPPSLPVALPRAAVPGAASLTLAPAPSFKPPPQATVEPFESLRMDRLFPLKCQVKTYAWGKFGLDSLVAQLAEVGLDEIEITAGTPYAEHVHTHACPPPHTHLRAHACAHACICMHAQVR